jgi:cobalt-precorrin-6B (C15)-methyltransferase
MWKYVTPGIPDHLFERLAGIPLTKKEVRLLLISALRMENNSILWDIGAGTGTIPIEIGLLCPNSSIVAVERDEDVASLIRKNCENFAVKNVTIVEGNAPECLEEINPKPDRICLEGGKSIKGMLEAIWQYLPSSGRVVVTATNLESLYKISESFAQLQARNIEVVQSGVNRLETIGVQQTFVAMDPIFILSGEKL